ncbi:MAG: c-type cytochrome, partial [Pirellulales bacterium]
MRQKLYALAADDDQRVRYQLAFTLGDVNDAVPALTVLTQRDGSDRWMRLALQSSLRHKAPELFARLLDDSQARRSPGGRSMLESLAVQLGASRTDVEIVLQSMQNLPKEEVSLLRGLARGLNDGLAQSGTSLHALLAKGTGGHTAARFNELLTAARSVTADEKQPLPDRVDSVRILALGSLDDVRSLMASLLDNRQPQELQIAAIETLGQFNAPQVAETIVAAWPGMSPRVRTQATELMFARPERLNALLAAVEQGKVSPTELDPARIKLLQSHANAKLAERAKKVFASVQISKRNEVIDAYRSALAMPGDRARGQAVFKKICAACHKLEGQGHEIGPNLATMLSRGPEAILVNVLDPNREVNPQYVNYVLVTGDGRSLTGMIAAETATSVTLRRAEGASDTVLRVHIEELQSTRLSIMPEGVEKQVDPQGMADLLAYLTTQAAPANAPAANAPAAKGPEFKTPAAGAATGWKAGAAKRVITPRENMWMSGYGGRDKPSEGKLTDLYAKA